MAEFWGRIHKKIVKLLLILRTGLKYQLRRFLAKYCDSVSGVLSQFLNFSTFALCNYFDNLLSTIISTYLKHQRKFLNFLPIFLTGPNLFILVREYYVIYFPYWSHLNYVQVQQRTQFKEKQYPFALNGQCCFYFSCKNEICSRINFQFLHQTAFE